MASMNSKTIQSIIAIATTQGFHVELKADGSHLYVKNLTFSDADHRSWLFVHRETGIDKMSGQPNYLKVAVHPDRFRPELIDPDVGIKDFPNGRSKINRHSGSNYVGFPIFDGNDEPCATCYKVNLDALGRLLQGLRYA